MSPISASTFTRPPTQAPAAELTKAIKNFEWSAGQIFLAIFTLSGSAICRAIYHAVVDEKKVNLYFQGNAALLKAYLDKKTESIDGKKQVTVQLDGKDLTLKEVEVDGKPALTYEYNGKVSCTADKGKFMTLDVWVLVELSKIKTDDAYFQFFRDRGFITEQERSNFYPDKFETVKPNFQNVDFSALPALDLRGIKLNNPNMDGATLANIDLRESTITGGKFNGTVIGNNVRFGDTKVYFCDFSKVRGELNETDFEDQGVGVGLRAKFPKGATSSSNVNSEENNFKPYQTNFGFGEQDFASRFRQDKYRPKYESEVDDEYISSDSEGEEEFQPEEVSEEASFDFVPPPTLKGKKETDVGVGEPGMIRLACQILGMPEKSKHELTYEEFNTASRKMVRQAHPDKNNGDDTQFKEVNEAIAYLKGNAFLSKKWGPEQAALNEKKEQAFNRHDQYRFKEPEHI